MEAGGDQADFLGDQGGIAKTADVEIVCRIQVKARAEAVVRPQYPHGDKHGGHLDDTGRHQGLIGIAGAEETAGAVRHGQGAPVQQTLHVRAKGRLRLSGDGAGENQEQCPKRRLIAKKMAGARHGTKKGFL